MIDQACKKYVDLLKEKHLARALCLKDSAPLDFSHNDFFGLSQSPVVIEEALRAAKASGVGSTGSRLLSGNRPFFHAFEKQIANDTNTEQALLFSSGYQANSTVLKTLLQLSAETEHPPLVFFDKFNHRSLYDSILQTHAKIIRYPHANYEALEAQLKKHAHLPNLKFIVCESLYGMDGDIVDLKKIADYAKEYQAFLYIDEAYGMGLLGKNGYGLSSTIDFNHVSYLIMGTFSKALGGQGAFVGCSQAVSEYLLNRCPGFFYSTAPSPMLMGAAQAAWSCLATLEAERQKIFRLGELLRTQLKALGFDTGLSNSFIVPIILGKELHALKAQKYLKERGILVSAIRPPTIPPGTSRLRIAINCMHHEKDITQLIEGLKNL